MLQADFPPQLVVAQLRFKGSGLGNIVQQGAADDELQGKTPASPRQAAADEAGHPTDHHGMGPNIGQHRILLHEPKTLGNGGNHP